MDEHEKWQSRRMFHETFGTSNTAFPNWRSLPNQCNCGCGEVWYDRLSPTNRWTAFNPSGYLSAARRLLGATRNLHRMVWVLPSLIWHLLQMRRRGYRREVIERVQTDASATVAIAAARLLLYGVLAPLGLVAWATAWTLSRPGIPLFVALYFLALALVASGYLIVITVSAIAISFVSLVFILGAVGSFLYLDSPSLGIMAIIVGVLLQYELHRRDVRRREEHFGYLILLSQGRAWDRPHGNASEPDETVTS